MNIAPSKPVPVLLAHADETDATLAASHRPYLDFLARTQSVTVLPEDDEGPESATALVGDMKILIPLAGLIDKDAEMTRLDKEIGKLEKEREKSEKKLKNPNFIDKAPEVVVAKERVRLEEMRTALSNLNEQKSRISGL